LIESRGRKAFLEYLADGMTDDNWPRAVERHFGFAHLGLMQEAWMEWVKSGRPRLTTETSLITQQLARRSGGVTTVSASSESKADNTAVAIRGQSPDDIRPIPPAAPERGPSAVEADPLTAGSSVYAVTAARAADERRQPVRTLESSVPSAGGPSIYDASRDTGVIRR
jgi:hypothetical protein